MRRKQRLVSTIRTALPSTTTNPIGEVVTGGWTDPVERRATVLPISDATSIELYGERVKAMRRVIGAELKPGMGVWLQGETDATPPWRVASAEDWPNHTTAMIERRVS